MKKLDAVKKPAPVKKTDAAKKPKPEKKLAVSKKLHSPKKLDAEEHAILAAYEADEFKSVAGAKLEINRHKTYAEATFQKDSRINIRISSKDLRLLQKRALREGLPYQTLIASLLHKYVEGRLVEQS